MGTVGHLEGPALFLQYPLTGETGCVPGSVWKLYRGCEWVLVSDLYSVNISVARSWWGNRRERDNWGNLGVDGWIILGWISRGWDMGIWTGLGWPRIETGAGRL